MRSLHDLYLPGESISISFSLLRHTPYSQRQLVDINFIFSSNHYSGMTIAVSAGGILFEAIFAINVRTLPVICVVIADLF